MTRHAALTLAVIGLAGLCTGCGEATPLERLRHALEAEYGPEAKVRVGYLPGRGRRYSSAELR